MGHPIPEQRAIGEAGERIVEGLVLELVLEPLALRHVAEVEDDASHRPVGEEVQADGVDPPPRSVGVPQPERRRLLRRRLRQARHELVEPGAVVGVDVVGELTPDTGVRIVTEHAPEGIALVGDPPVAGR